MKKYQNKFQVIKYNKIEALFIKMFHTPFSDIHGKISEFSLQQEMTLYRGQSRPLDLQLPPGWESNNEPPCISKEVINLNGEEVGLILKNVLTSSECEHYINLASETVREGTHAQKYRKIWQLQSICETFTQPVHRFCHLCVVSAQLEHDEVS